MRSPAIIPREFYRRDTLKVAPTLLGNHLVRVIANERLVGRIVEVEAYRGRDDPASHAFHGPTPRNAPMFGEPGHAYVYFTYGNHHCLNITTQEAGVAGAVLLRALEPVQGIETMRRLRPNVSDSELTNGPGKLTRALSVDLSINEQDITIPGPLYVSKPDPYPSKFEVWRSVRIGIQEGLDKRWRFYLKGNSYVSRGSGLRATKYRYRHPK